MMQQKASMTSLSTMNLSLELVLTTRLSAMTVLVTSLTHFVATFGRRKYLQVTSLTDDNVQGCQVRMVEPCRQCKLHRPCISLLVDHMKSYDARDGDGSTEVA